MFTSSKLRQFGTTVFSEMTALAIQHEAINLSQGFPDFEGPPAVIEAACDALRAGHNQYARSMGVPPLVEAIADHVEHHHGLRYDPMQEVTVFCGCTEGLMASMLGVLDPGDEVIFFEPVYDSYQACAAMAGAVPRYGTLRFPDFNLDVDELTALFNERTRLLVLNSPHNPTGKVFTRQELETIAELCIRHDVLVLTDEVYEQILFDDRPHVPIASIDGMRERTLSLSSIGKTFSFTGFKIGWGTGPAPFVKAAQAAHQFMTFCAAAPLQHASAHALRLGMRTDFFTELRREYTARRDFLVKMLDDVGLNVATPEGTYFALADFSKIFDGDDITFAKFLTSEIRVAAIPPSVFFPKDKQAGRSLVRFAFCKQLKTLEAASERLRALPEALRTFATS